MEKDVFDIIRDKEFIELSKDEQIEVSESCESEDQYNQMKHILQQVGSMKVETPEVSDKTKLSLDHLFDEQYAKGKRIWYMSAMAVIAPAGKPIYKQPMFYAAAVILALFMVIPIGNDILPVNNEQIAQLDEEQITSNEPEVVVEAEKKEDVDEADLSPAEIQQNRNVTSNGVEGTTFTWSAGASSDPGLGFSSSRESEEFNHPDGIYEEWATEENLCVSVSRQPEVLDLLTATF